MGVMGYSLKNRETFAHPWEQVLGGFSQVLLLAGKE